MKLFNSTKKKVAVLATAAAVVASTGIASAYWTSDGSGVGSATVDTDTAWEVTTTADSGNLELSPDGPTDLFTINVKNNGSGVQRLQQLDISVANSDGTTWDGFGTCSAADFSVGGAAAGATKTIGSLTDDIGSGLTNSDHSVTLQMVDTHANQDDCRNVTVPLYVVAS